MVLRMFAGISVFVGFGTPQLGQVLARVETALPHSLHSDIAIQIPYQYSNQVSR